MLSSRLTALLLVSTATTSGLIHCRSTFGADMTPKLKYEVPMPKDAFFSPLGKKTEDECNQLHHLLLDPDTMFSPDKRAVLLKTAKPILLQYRADFDTLTAQYPSMAAGDHAIHQETIQRLALLGDEDTLKMLQADADGPDVQKIAHRQRHLDRQRLDDGRWQYRQADGHRRPAGRARSRAS